MMSSEFNVELQSGRTSIVLTFDNAYSITASWGMDQDCANIEAETYHNDFLDLFSIPNVQVTVQDSDGATVPFSKGKNHMARVTPEEFIQIAYRVSSIGKEIVDE